MEDKLKALDLDLIIPDAGKYGIVGIFEGVKQAAEFELVIEKAEVESTREHIDATLQDFGLAYLVSCMDYPDGRAYLLYDVAKTPELAEVVSDYRDGEFIRPANLAEKERLRGQLFGFPETAIDYFIAHIDSGLPNTPVDDNPKYHSYRHSPDHAEQEYAQYEQVLDAAFRKYCPNSAAKLLDD